MARAHCPFGSSLRKYFKKANGSVIYDGTVNSGNVHEMKM